MMRVGIVGVGRMGSAMAARVLAAGMPLIVYDTRREACEPLESQGARVASSPREVAASSDVVCVVVLDDAQVRQVMIGADGLLAAAHEAMVVAIHATINVETVLEVAAEAARRGVAVVDAGVSGSVGGAEQGQLAVMAGGDADAFARCRPVFDCYGGLVLRMGELGAGMKAKIARQAILFLSATAVYEGMRLAERAGVDLRALGDIVRHSDRYAQLNETFWGRGTAEPADESTEAGRRWLQIARYTCPISEKDLGAALQLAESLGIELPVTEKARARMPEVWGLR